jgi:peroxiredoxin Q/BCP
VLSVAKNKKRRLKMSQEHKLNIGDKAPEFCLPDQEDRQVCLKEYEGRWVVLYFYPRDNTPGCTVEAVDFTAVKKELETMNAVVLGVSPDSSKSHRNFIAKKELTITLLSDPEHRVIEMYGAWQLKKNYGREFYGVVRSTFLIDPGGRIAHLWPNVKAKGHAEAVKEKLKEI